MDISRINTKGMSTEMLDMLYRSLMLSGNTRPEGRYDGLHSCFKNVIKTNNSRKLQYCKAR